MSKFSLLEIPLDLVHSRIPMLHVCVKKDVSLHNDLWHKQHTNSCNQRVRNLRVFVLLHS